jgi:hypothetical protein
VKAETISLGELQRLVENLEGGGAKGLSDADLAFVGAVTSGIRIQVARVLALVEKEAYDRLQAREAKVLHQNGSSITKHDGKPTYHIDANAMVERIMQLDVEAVGDLFEFVPAKSETVVTPAGWRTRNTTKLKNWVEKLGTSQDRIELEKLLGITTGAPSLTYRAVDPESGEIL